jgi:hypothetical protein
MGSINTIAATRRTNAGNIAIATRIADGVQSGRGWVLARGIVAVRKNRINSCRLPAINDAFIPGIGVMLTIAPGVVDHMRAQRRIEVLAVEVPGSQ